MDLADASLYGFANETGVTELLTTDVAELSRYRLSYMTNEDKDAAAALRRTGVIVPVRIVGEQAHFKGEKPPGAVHTSQLMKSMSVSNLPHS